MTDYKIYATNEFTGNKYVGKGGYYTGITGNVFNYEITFYLKPTRKSIKEKELKELARLKAKYEIAT